MKTRPSFRWILAAILIGGAALARAQGQEATPPNGNLQARVAAVMASVSPSAAEVVRMYEQGIGSSVIEAFVQNSQKASNLTATDIVYLHDHGIPDSITTAMIQHQAALRQQAGQPAAPAPAPTPGYAAPQMPPTASYAYPSQAVYPDYADAAYASYPYYDYSYPSYSYGFYAGFPFWFPFNSGCGFRGFSHFSRPCFSPGFRAPFFRHNGLTVTAGRTHFASGFAPRFGGSFASASTHFAPRFGGSFASAPAHFAPRVSGSFHGGGFHSMGGGGRRSR